MAGTSRSQESPTSDHTAVEPMYGRIPDVDHLYGLKRSSIYRLAKAKKIRLVKLGRTTLVDLASVRAFMATLPQAEIH